MKERERRLSLERLKECLDYDPDTGVFRWRTRTSNRIAVGDVAGQLDYHGHRLISVDGIRYAAHRLAWFYVYGTWPADEIDHIDLAKDNNRISNLRECDRAGNCRNVGRKRHNKSGFKGVCRHSQSKNRFVAQITVNGRPRYLGLFDTAEQAHAAYVSASSTLHGQFGRPS